jgi:hypothetical protein
VNGFVHGLTVIKNKLHEHRLPRGKDKRFKLELLNELITDAGGAKEITAARRLQAEIIATDAVFIAQMDRAIQRVFRLNPKYKENAAASLFFLRQCQVYFLSRFRHRTSTAEHSRRGNGPQLAGGICRY